VSSFAFWTASIRAAEIIHSPKNAIHSTHTLAGGNIVAPKRPTIKARAKIKEILVVFIYASAYDNSTSKNLCQILFPIIHKFRTLSWIAIKKEIELSRILNFLFAPELQNQI